MVRLSLFFFSPPPFFSLHVSCVFFFSGWMDGGGEGGVGVLNHGDQEVGANM